MNEIWKDIVGYDYNYQVSNFGNVRNNNSFFKSRRGENFILNKDVRGYARVGLVKNKKVYSVKVHRLVAMYFLEDYKPEFTVNHKDFDKSNNHFSNLEMMTITENVIHYQEKLNNEIGSTCIGIKYHKGINKWVARCTFNGKRYNLGSFQTEEEAIKALKNFKEAKDVSMLKIGKGSSNKGRSKYSEEDDIKALKLSVELGIREAGRLTGMGSTRISKLRKQYNKKLWETGNTF